MTVPCNDKYFSLIWWNLILHAFNSLKSSNACSMGAWREHNFNRAMTEQMCAPDQA